MYSVLFLFTSLLPPHFLTTTFSGFHANLVRNYLYLRRWPVAFALDTMNSTPVWQALVANGQLNSPEMGFWFAHSTSSSDVDVPGGMFTLSGTNSSLYTGDVDLTNPAVIPPSLWLLNLTGGFPVLLDDRLLMRGG